MPYKLIGSIRSPYVRVCRMLLLKHKIDFEFHVLDFVNDVKDANELSAQTPINKVPVLFDGSQKIYDSRVIVSYLAKKHALPVLTWEEENLISLIYACLDSGVILFLLKRDGFDINSSGFFISRHRSRIPHCLNHLTEWALSLDSSKSSDWNYPSMSLYSFLYWAQAREVIQLNSYPRLKLFMERFKDSLGVHETTF